MQRIIFFLLSALVLFSFPSSAVSSQKQFAILTCGHDCGMFRTVASLTGLLYMYEKGHYTGVQVDFGTGGLYYDPSYGPNWWEYYFEPIYVGDDTDSVPFVNCNGPVGSDYAWLTEFHLKRKQVYDLINKYIRLKPQMQKKVDDFASKHFSGDVVVIGVHYRGTDKTSEAPRAAYNTMYNHIATAMHEFKKKKIKIFVATDEAGFLDYMKRAFPKQVISYEEALHSTSKEPIHKSNASPYKKGEDAVMDCLLLSRCHYLIKTSSNLSLFSSYFNPFMPVVHVTVRPWSTPLE